MRLLLKPSRSLKETAAIAVLDERAYAAVVGSVMHDDEFVEAALRMVQHALQQFALPMDADDQGEFGHD